MQQAQNKTYIWIILASILVHLAVIGGLPMVEKETIQTEPKRVKARLIAPKPKPIPKVPVIEKKKPEVEKPKPPEIKPKPPTKKKKKKAKKRKGRKKRLPPKTLTVEKKTEAPASTAVLPTSSDRVGSVLDLGDLDPDATDEELNRSFDADAEEAEKLVEATPAPEKKVQKDRKAECKRCIKPKPPVETTALLPADLILSISVRKDGTVSKVSIAKGIDPVLDEEAKRVAMTWTFKPAIKNGIRVKDQIPMTVEFK